MNQTTIFLTQLITSIIVFSAFAKWIITPWLNEKSHATSMMILVAPHATRHIGLTFLVPSVTVAGIPSDFAFFTAWGDMVSAVLAMLVIVSLRYQWRFSVPLLWLFNVFGFGDLLMALSTVEAIPTLGGTWFIPTFLVPVLLVTHVMIFSRLLTRQPLFQKA